jgi:ATP-dependent DNA helicase RecG
VSELAPRRLRQLGEVPIEQLRHVGDKRAAALRSLGLDSVLDLLTHYPRRHVDRTRRVDVSDLSVGDEAAVYGTVSAVRARRTRQGRSMVEITVVDDGEALDVVFFNQAWRANQLPEGTQALFFGKVSDYRARRQMANPVVDVIVAATGDERDAESDQLGGERVQASPVEDGR